MSDPLPYIATIKHTYTGPTGTNIYDFKNVKYETFGDGNVKDYHRGCNIIPLTKSHSAQDCLPKTGPSSNPPLFSYETYGMCSSLRPQSRSALFEPSPNETK